MVFRLCLCPAQFFPCRPRQNPYRRLPYPAHIRRQYQESRAEYELALASDLFKLNGMIGARSGAAPTAFAHPFGTDCDKAANVLKAVGIRCLFAVNTGLTT